MDKRPIALARFVLTALSFLSSCAPMQLQLHEDDLERLVSNPLIYVVTFKSPPFEVDTSNNVALIGGVLGGIGGAVGGALGAAAAGAVSNTAAGANVSADIRTDPRALVGAIIYEDPIKQVRDDFIRTLEDQLKELEFVVVEQSLEDEKEIAEKFQDG